jgi:DNA-binding transcriptional regulator GbsR (MarR family)
MPTISQETTLQQPSAAADAPPNATAAAGDAQTPRRSSPNQNNAADPPIESGEVRRRSPRIAALAAAAAAAATTAAVVPPPVLNNGFCSPCSEHRSESVKAKLVMPRKKRKGESKSDFEQRQKEFKTQTDDDLIVQQADYFLGIGKLPHCQKKTGDAKGFTQCKCLSILNNNHLLSSAVARYCVYFWKQDKFKQDQTMIEWVRYSGGDDGYRLPVSFSEEDDSTQIAEQLQELRSHKMCQNALCTIMDMTYPTLSSLVTRASTHGFAKKHGNTGKRHRAYKDDSDEIVALNDHMELLTGLAEQRSTREVASWSEDGTTVLHTLRDNGSDGNNEEKNIYLPSCTGYRACYNRYLKSCGYTVQHTDGRGVMKVVPVTGETQKNYVSIYKYYSFWKEKYPHLKISKPAEDICNLCYQFANRHKYQKSSTVGEAGVEGAANEDSSNNVDDSAAMIPSTIDKELFQDVVEPRRSSRQPKPRDEKARYLEPESDSDEDDFAPPIAEAPQFDACPGHEVEAAGTDEQVQISLTIGGDGPVGDDKWKEAVSKLAEPISEEISEMEKMLKRAAIHVEQAEKQRNMDNYYEEKAVSDAKNDVPFGEATFKCTGDYGQVIMLPSFAKEQPGFVYYTSKWSVQNFGFVNHAYKYTDGRDPQCHMDAHIFQEGVSQKGANSVASLVVKSLKDWGIIREGEVGGHLVISFDNCGGQNKNNCMIQLLMYLYERGYFKKITFLFLVAGHTKNACDRIFNLLKQDYRKKNLFTMDELEDALSKSSYVTVKRAKPEDFLDYTEFLAKFYNKLPNQINQNHVFMCGPEKDEREDLRNAKAY